MTTRAPALGSAGAAQISPRRIVSLVPSLTEALFALGAGERLVGVTRFCEEPAAQVALLPKLGGTKNPAIAEILALRPDIVVASSEENREEDVAALRAAGVAVLVTHYETVAQALDGLKALADLVGTGTATALSWRSDALAATAALGADARPVRYFCPIWRNPYMTARRDTYMADLLALAGGVDAAPLDGPLHYNAIDLATAFAQQPEIVLLPDEPYRFRPRHAADFAPFASAPAVRNERIVCCDGKLLTWYGPRTPHALRYFGALFAAVRQRNQREH